MVPQGYPSTAQPSQLGAIEHAARHVEQGMSQASCFHHHVLERTSD